MKQYGSLSISSMYSWSDKDGHAGSTQFILTINKYRVRICAVSYTMYCDMRKNRFSTLLAGYVKILKRDEPHYIADKHRAG